MRLSQLLSRVPVLVCTLAMFFAGCAHSVVPSARASRTVPGLELKLQTIPAGVFTMGSPMDEVGRYDNEEPLTRVTISHAFWLGRYEVTQGQWKALMGTDVIEQARRMLADDTLYDGKTQRDAMGATKDTDPKKLIRELGDDYPMIFVSWNEAETFCRKLTDRERSAGRLPAGYEYRLPTEAEWEYACRAGTKEATYAGKMEIKDEHNAPGLDAIARFFSTGGGGKVGLGQVGSKQPNGWGLYDMLGNVDEWCRDWYAHELPGGIVSDPHGPGKGSFRVVRGGSFVSTARQVRAANRDFAGLDPGLRRGYLGFRVALSLSLP